LNERPLPGGKRKDKAKLKDKPKPNLPDLRKWTADLQGKKERSCSEISLKVRRGEQKKKRRDDKEKGHLSS